MKRWLLTTAAISVLALAVGGVSLAERSRGGIVEDEVRRFVDVRVQVRYLDLGRRAQGDFDPSPGDTFFFRNRLRNSADTETIGWFVSKCTALIGTRFKCSGTLLLPRGTVELAGTPDFAAGGPIVSAVVGGTGRFRNVGGQAKITATETPGTSRLVVRLKAIP
jgi:hypothetical protein